MGRLQQITVSGLIVVGPLAVTMIAVTALLREIASLSAIADIEPAYLRIPVVILVFGLVTLSMGYLMRTAIGNVIAGAITEAINHVPMLRVVYNASQVAVETALTEKTVTPEPVMIEAWDGLRVTAFTTGKRADDGRLICFFPTAPNVTTGYVIEVREEDVTRTGERIESALVRLLSAGLGEDREGSPGPPVGGTARRVHGVDVAPAEE